MLEILCGVVGTMPSNQPLEIASQVLNRTRDKINRKYIRIVRRLRNMIYQPGSRIYHKYCHKATPQLKLRRVYCQDWTRSGVKGPLQNIITLM